MLVEVPERLRDRPLDAKGRIIPWMAPVDDEGNVSFGKNHEELRHRAIMESLCGQCGKPTDYWLWFIGDDVLLDVIEAMEPPMHEDCARYAISVCPFLGHENYQTKPHPMFTIDEKHGYAIIADSFYDPRPPRMCLLKTRNYKVVHKRGGLPVARLAKLAAVEWF